MRTINKLESEIVKICNCDFIVNTSSAYKDKNVIVFIGVKKFKSSSDNWEGAINAVFKQIQGYINSIKKEVKNVK